MCVLFVRMVFVFDVFVSRAIMGMRSGFFDRLGTRDKGSQTLKEFVEHLAARKQLLDLQSYVGALFRCLCKCTIIAIHRHVFDFLGEIVARG